MRKDCDTVGTLKKEEVATEIERTKAQRSRGESHYSTE